MRATNQPCSCRLVCETELADARLDTRRRPPAVLDRLVAAYVDVFAGEQVDHFVEDVFEEVERRFVGIEETVMHAPVGRYRGRPPVPSHG